MPAGRLAWQPPRHLARPGRPRGTLTFFIHSQHGGTSAEQGLDNGGQPVPRCDVERPGRGEAVVRAPSRGSEAAAGPWLRMSGQTGGRAARGTARGGPEGQALQARVPSALTTCTKQ